MQYEEEVIYLATEKYSKNIAHIVRYILEDRQEETCEK